VSDLVADTISKIPNAAMMAKTVPFAARTEYYRATNAMKTAITANGPNLISVLHLLTITSLSVAGGLVLEVVYAAAGVHFSTGGEMRCRREFSDHRYPIYI
jgi:hypothetical protein